MYSRNQFTHNSFRGTYDKKKSSNIVNTYAYESTLCKNTNKIELFY